MVLRPSILIQCGKYSHWIRILLVAAVVAATGCTRLSSRGKVAVAEWPAPPPLPDETEQRIEGLARYAAGLSLEMNNQSTNATDAFYQAALADLDQEALVIEVAGRLIREEKSAQAIDLLKKAAEQPDASGQLHAWLGLAYLQSGQTNLAVQANQRAIKQVPDNLAAYQSLSQIHLQAGRTNEARAVIERATHRDEAPPEFYLGLSELIARFNRQQLYSDDESRSRILSLLDKASAAPGENPIIQQRMADLYLLHGQPLKAEPIYAALYEKYPTAPGLREKLANIYLRTDQNDKAARLLEGIREDNPTDPSTHYFIGSLAFENKQFEKAAEAFETALTLNPNFEPVYFDLAGVNLSMGRPAEALEVLNKARGRFKLNFLLEFYTGVAKASMEDYSEALSHLTSAELLAKTSEPARLTHNFYFQLGSVHERSGNIPEAVAAFRKCLQLSPDFPEALNYLGYMWAERGENLEEAREMIEKAVRAEPENAAYLDSLAWVLYKLDRANEALPHMNTAIANSEEPDPTLFDHLGDIHRKLDQLDQAREAYSRALAIKNDPAIEEKLQQIK